MSAKTVTIEKVRGHLLTSIKLIDKALGPADSWEWDADEEDLRGLQSELEMILDLYSHLLGSQIGKE